MTDWWKRSEGAERQKCCNNIRMRDYYNKNAAGAVGRKG